MIVEEHLKLKKPNSNNSESESENAIHEAFSSTLADANQRLHIGQWPKRMIPHNVPLSPGYGSALSGAELSTLEQVIQGEAGQGATAAGNQLAVEPRANQQTQATTTTLRIGRINYNQYEWFHVLIAMVLLLVVELAIYVIVLQVNFFDAFYWITVYIAFILAATFVFAGFFVVMSDLNRLAGHLLERFLKIPRLPQRKILRFMTFCFFGVIVVLGGSLFLLFGLSPDGKALQRTKSEDWVLYGRGFSAK